MLLQKSSFLVFIFWCCAMLPALGQEVQIIGVKEGLPRGFVKAICRDDRGFLWTGTLDGICRYDGERFKVYSDSDKKRGDLTAHNILKFFNDRKGKVWLFTDNDLYYYNDQIDIFQDKTPWKNRKNFNYGFDGKGNIWAFSADTAFCYHINEDARTISLAPEHSFQLPFRLDESSQITITDTSLIYCFESELFSFNIKNKKNWKLPIHLAGGADHISMDTKYRHIWVGTPSQIGYWNNNTFKDLTVQPQQSDFTGNTVINEGNSSFLLAGGGLLQWDGKQLKSIETGYNGKIVTSYVDTEGNIWLGSDAVGILKIKTKPVHFKSVLHGKYIPNKKIVVENEKSVWVYESMPKPHKLQRGFYRQAIPTSGNSIQNFEAMDADENGQFWAVTSDQWLVKNSGGNIWSKQYRLKLSKNGVYINHVYCAEGKVWLFSNFLDIVVFDPHTSKAIQTKLSDFSNIADDWIVDINSICADQNAVYVSTSFGLAYLLPEWSPGKMKTHFWSTEENEALSAIKKIYCALPDSSGRIWLGTPVGLYRFDLKSGRYNAFSTDILQKKDIIFTMLTAEGSLWLGTQRGLIQVNLSTKNSRLFTLSDGLPALEFNRATSVRARSGKVYMGTVGGMISFAPRNIPADEKAWSICITEVRIGDSTFRVSQDVPGRIPVFRYNQNYITIGYALLDLLDAPSNIYQYRLNGNAWNPLNSENAVTLAGLAPGEYLFEVRGRNGKTGWSAPTHFSFVISAPWWQRWWAYVLYALLLGGTPAFYLLYRFKLHKIKVRFANERAEEQRKTELEQYKAKLLTNVAHDLQSPLTIILAMANKLTDAKNSAFGPESAAIRQSSAELQELVNQMLEISKLQETGYLPLKIIQGDLRELILVIAQPFIHFAAEKQIQLNVLTPDFPVYVKYDEQAVRSVLSNLLSNALKYTPTGGNIRMELKAPMEGKIELRVFDSGKGIEEIHRAHIFERFFRANPEEQHKGVGIGLWYASELIKLMGGSLAVIDTDLPGATFQVVLPYTFEPAPEPEGEIPLETGDKRPLILVVEDNTALNDYISEGLGDVYQIIRAGDGLEGLALAQRHVPDLVLSDVVMPGMDGYALCETIKNDRRTSHVPVLLLTAKHDPASVKMGLKSGADAYLSKPFDLEDLRLRLHNILALRNNLQRHHLRIAFTSGTIPEHAEILPEKADEVEFLQEIQRLLELNYTDSQYGIEGFAKELGMSKSNLYRKVTALTGTSLGDLLRTFRLNKAREMVLNHPGKNNSEIAYACGFSDPKYFSKAFFAEFGVRPAELRDVSKMD